ncbi:PucR family transcriptional regulator [Streptosporangium sp. G11]|uniref:PucR family transcriptional regulator n=1 Tax=Streptosporangium sp. G11 TaxID=3436926 RepID=UPI003EBF49AF
MNVPSAAWLLRLAPRGEVPEPASSSVVLAAAASRLGPGPVGWAVKLAHRMTEDIIEQVPEHGGGPAPFETLRRSVEATVLTALEGLLHEVPPTPDLVAPAAVEGDAEHARRGIALDRVLRGVRLGHAMLHRALIAALEEEPEEVRAAEGRRVAETLFAYADVQASRLAEEYIAERERWRAGSAAARRRIVDDLLAGRAVAVEKSSRTLGYELRNHHRAFVVSATGPETLSEEVQRFAETLGEATGAQGLLVVRADPRETWVWAGWAAHPPAGLIADLRDRLEAPEGLTAAAGPASHGPAGVRRSHHGAREAARVGRAGWLADYAENRVPALITADAEHARWFAEETLGELLGGDARSRELRETLRVYLACGRSPQTAAGLLHIARNTVVYRVRAAEEILGRAIGDDPLEIRLALEIAPTLS